ncbi:MAG: FAD-dependent oxidoreductase [Planctomycetaceae bacterium]|nr:FAD-dependent oxidoreductase [Planctomycetaceae bacterium]
MSKRFFSFCFVVFFFCCSVIVFGESQQFDVVIYGGTSAAVTSAVQVKKMGQTVIIVSPDKHLGGLSSGGLGFTDSGNTSTVGGLSREFYQRIYTVYQNEKTWRWQKISEYTNLGQGTKAMLHDDKTMWIFEPHVAETVFDAWIEEHKIPVVRNTWLDRKNGVKKNGTQIVSMTTLDGQTFVGKMFIDATYEGDLMAAAGVDYHVGRESNDQYGETWNGNQVGTLHHGHWFKKPVDPYVISGDPKSGRLKYIDDSKPGIRGEADHRVQAYCFRMCLTNHEPNRVPFPKPDDYNPNDYELYVRVFQTGWRETFNKFDQIPNHKTDTNNHGPFSTDFIGMNYDYPDASYERREEIITEHKKYQQGLMYFLANEERVPEDVRKKMPQWGLAKDEFIDNENWPHQIYVREARRMVGEYVTTELDCMAKRRCPKPVGLGSYALDSHNVRRYVTPEGTVQNEGDIGVSPRGPYGIDFGSIVPKREQCTNLLVPVCVSSSHIAFGSIRMEPVFMILGQSAATAAVLAIHENCEVQKLDYEKLREHLIADGQRLVYSKQNKVNPNSVGADKLEGNICDNNSAKVTGNWDSSSSIPKFVENDYLHDANENKGNKSAEFSFKITKQGNYSVCVSYTPNPNRSTAVPVKVIHRDGESTVMVDQTRKPTLDNLFVPLGIFPFDKTATIIISNTGTTGYVVVDAVQLILQTP